AGGRGAGAGVPLPADFRAWLPDPDDAAAYPIVSYTCREAAFGMGATHWEVILRVLLPTASTGIFGALVLGFGCALGETMALAMLIGNAHQLRLSLLSLAHTLAALLALHFPEAT